MLSRILLPLTLACAALGGCTSFETATFAKAIGLAPASVFAEAPQPPGNTEWQPSINRDGQPSINGDGTAVAGWISTVTRDDVAVPEPAGAHDAYRLDSGDKLRVFVYAQPSLSRIYAIDTEGFISVPLIGNVRARGTTTRALESAIAGRLGTEFVRDPHVTVDIQQYRPFFILGEVRTAGQYPFVGGLTVDAAVAIAGGYSERANEGKVQITRRINDGVEKLEVPGDAEVRPGDTIHVRERWF